MRPWLTFANTSRLRLRRSSTLCHLSIEAQSKTDPESGDMTLAEIFDQLDWETVESYVELKQEEHLHLEFKTLRNAELTNRDDKLNLARSISGFANSSGGILIWGIDARKNDDNIDCASSIVELQKPAVLVSRLNTLSGEATSPSIVGLQHKQIINSLSSGGVAATFVPETDGGPYMALLGEQRYYKRSGDSFTEWSTLILRTCSGGDKRQLFNCL